MYFHKNRGDTRRPNVKRRGAALEPLYDAFGRALTGNKKLCLAHETKGAGPCSSSIAIDEPTSSV